VLIAYLFLITGAICPTAYVSVANRIGELEFFSHYYKFQPSLSEAGGGGLARLLRPLLL